MYSNGINSYTPIKEDNLKPKIDTQFNFDGEAFSDLMDKEETAGGGLRETAQEIAEDESILSTDEENRAMIKKRQNPTEFQKVVPAGQEDKARLLRLMDMSNKINMNINISKSKKELETTVGPVIDENEPEDITSVISKMMLTKENETADLEADVQSSLDLEKHLNDYDEEKDNSQVLHETEEELAEDEAILSTEEENLEMARRNMASKRLSDEDYKTTEEDMMFLNEIVALNNQVHVEKSTRKQATENILNALMSQTMNVSSTHNKIDISELKKSDIDCLIGFLRKGVVDSAPFVDENNDELNFLSRKFVALLKDSIINNKVFRIDFDNDVSVIIRINKEGQLQVELQTTDADMAKHIKENLHILREKFEALNVNYEDIKIKEMN